MWYSNDMFHYMFQAEFVTLVSLKVPSGRDGWGGWGVEKHEENMADLFACPGCGTLGLG